MRVRFWWENQEIKVSLGRRGCKWEDNNNMDAREMRWNDMDWVIVTQGRDQ
jgi:hypothetical protein